MGTRLADQTPIALQVQNDGVALPREPGLNFIGAGVTASHDAANDRINVTIPGGGGGGGYDTIEEEGVAVAQETVMNFVGAGITATPGTGKTTITVPLSANSTTTLNNKTMGGDNNTFEEMNWSAMMRAEAAGKLPHWDDGGDPTELNIGSAGQVLTVNPGADSPIWADASGGITREQIANPLTDFYLYDEFFYPIPATSLLDHYETLGTFSAVNQVIGGQVTFQTASSANAICRINTCGGGLVAIDATKNWRLVVRCRQQTVTVNTALLIGFYTDGGAKPSGVFPFASDQPPNLFFRADGTGNYFAETDDGITPQSTDTTIVADTAFHVFEIRSDPAVPNIEFLIDGTVRATFTTNLPTGIKAMFIGCQTQTTAFTRVNVDSMFLYQDR